ncbi:MAG: hypothetical protein AAGK00_04610 [Pseudomonadota bacterium]
MFARVIAIAVLVLAPMLSFGTALADAPPILTISGEITNTNRGPSAADDTTVLGAQDIAFEAGFAVTRAELAALPQRSITTMAAGVEATFTGPALADTLALAGASGDTLIVTALDGYSVAMDRVFMEAHQPILAIAATGFSLAIGDYGPTMIVFPPTDDADLQDEFNGLQVWAILHISAE